MISIVIQCIHQFVYYGDVLPRPVTLIILLTNWSIDYLHSFLNSGNEIPRLSEFSSLAFKEFSSKKSIPSNFQREKYAFLFISPSMKLSVKKQCQIHRKQTAIVTRLQEEKLWHEGHLESWTSIPWIQPIELLLSAFLNTRWSETSPFHNWSVFNWNSECLVYRKINKILKTFLREIPYETL